MQWTSLIESAQPLVTLCLAKGKRLVSAESCTGGLVAAVLTSLPDSSKWFDRGYVTYSNEAKTELLGVSPLLIEQYGAVSEVVARQMAENALKKSPVNHSVAITGIAGPGGGSTEKPVGLVWFAFASRRAALDLLHNRSERTSVGGGCTAGTAMYKGVHEDSEERPTPNHVGAVGFARGLLDQINADPMDRIDSFVESHHFSGDRTTVRWAATMHALKRWYDLIATDPK